MSDIEIKGWFIGATVLSIIIAFISSSIETNRKYGNVYVSTTMEAWGKIFLTLLPLVIYVVISTQSGGWNNIFQSPEVAMGAFLILLLSCNELGCALSIKRKYPIARYKVSTVSMWALIWLCVALSSVIFIFQANEIPTAAVIGQFVLLFIAIATYFGTGVVVKLVEEGYVPQSSNK